MNPAAPDAALLRRFEPVVRSTKGDRFYPTDVEPYVRACGLWVQRPGEDAVRVVPPGGLTLERLPQQPLDEAGVVHFLKFTDGRDLPKSASREASRGELLKRAAGLKGRGERFRTGRGRLARVGYVSRFVDALYSITLLARGRVPGEAADAAAVAYGRVMAEREAYGYHGRVVRQDGWLVLQYWLFYPFNDWRSGFFGANDHEADWEKVHVYLSETEAGEPRPEWVAYASHNYWGDNLRRRWDDPEVEKVREHPVVYVGAGSHASYFAPGEYLTELTLPLPAPLARMTRSARSFWRRRLAQYAGIGRGGGAGSFRVPFVDYARGDGLTIGEGGDRAWDPPRVISDPVPAWVSGYRGLWGLYARDPFEGEDEPAGPMYNRDKTVSRAWYDPVGWAGLDKVPPPGASSEAARGRLADLDENRAALRKQIDDKGRQLRKLGVEAAAVRGRSHLDQRYAETTGKISALSRELDGLRARLASDEAVSAALTEYRGRLEAGEREPARAHISHAHMPASAADLRVSRVAEAWAAVSVSLMLVIFVTIALFERGHLFSMLVVSIALFAFAEAGFKGRLVNLVASANIGLAAVATLVLVYEFFWQLVVAAVLIFSIYVLWDNLRELRR